MSLIASVKTFLLTYSGLATGQAGMFVDTLSKIPIQYSLVPLPGQPVLESYLNDTELCQFPFALQSMESILDEDARLAAHTFYEAVGTWFKAQAIAKNFPTLDTGKTPVNLEVLGTPTLIQSGESGTGVYMLPLRVLYTQKQGV